MTAQRALRRRYRLEGVSYEGSGHMEEGAVIERGNRNTAVACSMAWSAPFDSLPIHTMQRADAYIESMLSGCP